MRLALIGVAMLCNAAWAGDSAAPDKPLPPMRFVSDAVGTDLFAPIAVASRFQKLSKEFSGSPFELRVYHTFEMTQGGRLGGNVSGLLSASTLGILPQMYSGEHAINYEVRVNGAIVAAYVFRKTLSRAHSIWSADTTHGLGKEGVDWAKSTVEQFLKESAADPKLSDLQAEYDFYFSGSST